MITCSAENFSIEQNGETIYAARFDEIARIVGFQEDQAVTDVVFFEIHSPGRQTIEVGEWVPGFDAWVARLENLPGFDRDWRDKVHWPPFSANETLLFERS